ncbi:hypothetical protein ARALYDRAFT_321472 [Arabidopsis lyrata subsp. lyrata]|uniref:C2 domain-containing protein n=1 Tax=Arabidopsis lyrata subsp. lyrata TaxID=81972 RepID=D7LKD1_ARALL|nr:hypothetical protein ARALYDRAFT_321472 [Arabidopsis lyrata subsp. lyrata]
MSNPEWNQVFAFSHCKQGRHSVGHCRFGLSESPDIIPSNCTVAPQWIQLYNSRNQRVEAEILLARFSGYQGDEQWNRDASYKGADALPDIRSQLYFTPKLTYLRVNVTQASNLVPKDPFARDPQYYVRVSLGNQTLTTRTSPGRNPMWNQDLMFVAVAPFVEHDLIISVEDRVNSSSFDVVGTGSITCQHYDRRSDDREVTSMGLDLVTCNPQVISRIYMTVCLDEGFSVQHESAFYTSDFRAADSKLWTPKIGVLELGILRASGLMSNAYCVAKYGDKWVRTKKTDGNFNWNEVYRWDVYDPYTVVTLAVFDDRDSMPLGKVRIRLSSLSTGRVYTHSYPLLVIQPNGVKKMGEIDLAVRFTCSSWLKLLRTYSQPLLPKMHYILPLPGSESLRRQAAEIVSMCLARTEPPLKKEVVDYILNLDSHSWSVRRSKVNHSRIVDTLAWSYNFLDEVCTWKSTPKTLFAAFCIFMFIVFPDMVLSFLPLLVFFTGLFFYFYSSDLPPHFDATLSQATRELDPEEFDTYPSSQLRDVVSERYDNLRRLAGEVQTVLGHVSSLVERLFLLFSWRDRRATALFLLFCLVTGAFLIPLWWFTSRYLPLFKVFQLLGTLYVMRPPRFRQRGLSWFFSFFWRLPSRHDDLF